MKNNINRIYIYIFNYICTRKLFSLKRSKIKFYIYKSAKYINSKHVAIIYILYNKNMYT